jgi:filamentous hemagglutinin family protein
MKKSLLIFTLFICHLPLQAEVITDGTLGAALSLPGPDYLIDDSLGQQFGSNLFHSLQTFDLNAGESATFTGPNSVENILTRVTGGNRSFIDGSIRSQIPNAHLYLLNPNGILFGENASLDITGSFHASTADYLRLGENGRFSARYPEHSLLTVAPPNAFGFLGSHQAIKVEGSYLQVPTTQTLSLVSGEIQMTDGPSKAATLYAPDGRINLITVESTGEVMLTDTQLSSFEKFGKISLSHAFGKRRANEPLQENYPDLKHANVDVSGEGGGQIVIRAGQLLMRNSSLFADTYGDKSHAAIDLFIKGEMQLIDGSKIAMNNVEGNSDQGDLKIIATEGLTLRGFFNVEPFDEPISAITTASMYSVGKGADIEIQAPKIEIAPGIIQTSTFSEAQAGHIKIEAEEVKLQGLMHNEEMILPAGINTATGGSGAAGDITINANAIIDLSHFSSLSAATIEGSSGAAGNIRLRTEDLRLTHAGEVISFSEGSGDAGNIEITANTASFRHNGNLVTEAFNASGGEIQLHITDRLSLVKSVITTEVQGDESDDHAGDIRLNHPSFLTLNQGEILAKANVGNGGNITMSAEKFIPSSDSLLDASSKLGIDGEIQITAGEENFSNSLVALSETLADASKLLAKSCVEKARDDSYFVVTGRIPENNIAKMRKSPQPPSFPNGLTKSERLARYQSLQTALSTAKASSAGRSEILGQLAALYANEQRYREALQLNQQALAQIELLNAPYSHYKLQWQRGRLFHALGEHLHAIIAYQSAIQKLTLIRQHLSQIYSNSERTEFREVLKPLFTELVALLLDLSEPVQTAAAKNDLLKMALQTMDQLKTAELQDYFQDDCTKPTTDLEKVDTQHTAIIYPIFLPNEVKLLVSLPQAQRLLKTIPATPEQLTEIVNTLIHQLCQDQNPACLEEQGYRDSAQQLYDWLIRPLEPVLSDDIDTLVFVPDGPLYAIPMAVLHDGEQFLIEKYALAVTPSLTLTEPTKQPASPKLLYTALTASKSPDFHPIQNYVSKLQCDFERIFGPITTLTGPDFIQSKVSQVLHTPHTITHVFSHAEFSANVRDSFIVTYNEKLSLNELEKLIAPKQYSDVPLDLLTLSACETAKGDERAALGLAGVAYKAGARSAIGTLWPVRDDVAYYLFKQFYHTFIKEQQPKAQALQQAQRRLLKFPSWQHPYYWSAFLLIGEWV